MFTGLLAYMTIVGCIACLVVLIITVGIPILIVRYLRHNKNEKQKLRMEIGKLADELEKTRKQNEDS